jgi:hypothetical protein
MSQKEPVIEILKVTDFFFAIFHFISYFFCKSFSKQCQILQMMLSSFYFWTKPFYLFKLIVAVGVMLLFVVENNLCFIYTKRLMQTKVHIKYYHKNCYYYIIFVHRNLLLLATNNVHNLVHNTVINWFLLCIF